MLLDGDRPLVLALWGVGGMLGSFRAVVCPRASLPSLWPQVWGVFGVIEEPRCAHGCFLAGRQGVPSPSPTWMLQEGSEGWWQHPGAGDPETCRGLLWG